MLGIESKTDKFEAGRPAELDHRVQSFSEDGSMLKY
jgi:hypothetical protein